MTLVDRPQSDAVEMTRRDVPRVRAILAAAAGLLILQIAWILAIPAFGGMDEFDHSYRASAVANGQWVAPVEAATRGTGAWMYVDPPLVRAALVECEALKYTSDADCVGSRHGDLTRVASGAGRYNPLFYAAIGYPTLVLDGSAAALAMRALTAVYSTGLVLIGLLAMRRWARNRWPFVGALLALTPTMVFSTAIVAPNGLEMAAGFAVWAAFLGLLIGDPEAPDLFVLTTATLSAVVLVTVRSLGPVWCVSIALVSVMAITGGVGKVVQLLRQRSVIIATGLVVLAAIVAVVWTRQMGTLTIGVVGGDPLSTSAKLGETAQQLPLWLFQGVAAFPYRNNGAPAVIYVCYLVLGLGLLVLGWKGADRRLRLAMGLTVFIAAVVPSAITFATFDSFGTSWQGRYGLPFSLGLMFLAGLGASQRTTAHRGPSRRLLGPTVLLYGICTTVGVVNVVNGQHRSPSAKAGLWTAPPTMLIFALAILGTCLLWSLVAPSRKPVP